MVHELKLMIDDSEAGSFQIQLIQSAQAKALKAI